MRSTTHMGPALDTRDESHTHRRVTVTPGMCSGGSLIFGRIGDWTWETVSSACRTNVCSARDADGQPTYLSFYYFHVRASGSLHPYGLTFGDEVDVTSRVFDFGSQSVVTLHRLRAADSTGDLRPLDPVEFYEHPNDDCIYVVNFNRWISRSRPGSNQRLVEASPPGFQHSHLPRLPGAYSPRAVAGRAREKASFHPDGIPGFSLAGPPFITTYRLDVVRDLNGVGLVYFASYFSIIDTALLRLWRTLHRSDQQFLRRRLVEHQLGYYGNADLDSMFIITVRLWRSDATPGREVADVAMRDQRTGHLLAVAAVDTLLEDAGCAPPDAMS